MVLNLGPALAGVLPQKQNLGGDLGTLIGQGLENYAKTHLQNMLEAKQRSQIQRGLGGVPGLNLTPEQAQNLAYLPEKDRAVALRTLLQQSNMATLGDLLNLSANRGEVQGFKEGEQQGINEGEEIERQAENQLLGKRVSPQMANLYYKGKELELKKQKYGTEQEKETARQQEKLQPFLHAHAQDVKHASEIGKVASRMKKTLEEFKDKFPNLYVGNLPEQFFSDPKVRKFIADARLLATLKANSRKGQPTNFKTKLELASKADINKPYETNIEILNDDIAATQYAHDIDKFIKDQKKNGLYPTDIETLVANREAAENNPLAYPELFQEGTTYMDDNGTIYKIENGSWEVQNG